MRNKVPRQLAKASTVSNANRKVGPAPEVVSGEMLARRRADDMGASSAIVPRSDNQTPGDVFKAKLSAALGCKTSETALALLDQIIALEHATTTASPEGGTAVLMTAMAQLTELQPATATEAMLAAQMVGTHSREARATASSAQRMWRELWALLAAADPTE